MIALILQHREALEALDVKSLNLFGSVARDQATSESDVDLLVDFAKSGGFFQLLQVQQYLEDLLGCQVDLGTQSALREHAREPILQEAVRVF